MQDKVFVWILVTILLGNCIPVSQAQEERNLLLSQIIFRHGARAPAWAYPTDPFKDESYWPDGWGQLTAVGKTGSYELGDYLSERYQDFLSLKFSSNEIQAISSDYDRTIMSAQALLSGLYKENGSTINNILWGLYPVRSLPGGYDTLIQPKILSDNPYPCPRFQELYKHAMESDDVKQHMEINKELYEFIKNESGVPNVGILEGFGVVDILHIQHLHNFNIPEWGKGIVESEENMRAISFVFNPVTFTNEMKRLSSGSLIGNMLENIKNKIGNQSERKLVLYSGHDLTLFSIMDTLGILDTSWVDFSNALIVELYNDTSVGEVIEIYFRNSTQDPPVQLRIPGCDIPCTIKAFEEFAHPFIPINLHNECQNKDVSSGSQTQALIPRVLLVFTSLLFGYLKNY